VLLAVVETWQNRRRELLEGSEHLTGAIRQQMELPTPEQADGREETLSGALHNLQRGFDPIHGGWGEGPKFPQPMALEFLLRHHSRTGDEQALRLVTQTLEAMARGGIYDQLGGGFHRYAVDDRWQVPHFEKMLYDNAQLARVYLHAWQVTDLPIYRVIAEETLDYVLREMTAPSGGFYATQDADSEGEEGKFFLWTEQEIRDTLGEQATPLIQTYGVTASGNFEGRNILALAGSLEERTALAAARRELFAVREQRIRPARDEKIIVAWNGLMLAALAEAARALGRNDYLDTAERGAAFLLQEMMSDDGRLRHTWQGGAAQGNGFLDDYTNFIAGLLELYQTTFDPGWYRAARKLAEAMIAHFSAPVGFFDTASDGEALIVRPRELQDHATPSGNGMAAFVLLRLAALAAEPGYAEIALRSLDSLQPLLARYPLGFGQWLIALDEAVAERREIAIAGAPEAADSRALLDVCHNGYRPHQVIAVGLDQENPVPLLQGCGQIAGRAAAYICAHSTCHPPITEAEELRERLAELDHTRRGGS